MTDPSNAGSDPESLPEDREEDPRSDLEQMVAARSDAVDRGEGGPEPETFTASGRADGVGGTGGDVRNQDSDAQ